jgi:pimeloyl-ACP methyl ester carboxylesterase
MSMQVQVARWTISVLLLASACCALAEEPWKRLPPMPSLPPDTGGQYAQINGARIWYAQWGAAHNGAPVLLLHGGYGNSNYFGYLIPDLVAHGYRVIAMDSRGHGRSTRTAEPYSYHLMATDVVGLLDVLKIAQVSLVGWSDGGCIGYDLAIYHPERLGRLFAFGADADVSGLIDGFDQNPIFAAYLARVKSEYQQLSPTPDEWDEFNAGVSKMWETQPNFTAEQLRTIRLPTTIADGQYDEGIKPAHNRYLAATIPGAKLVILSNVSHFAMLQNPAEFNTAVLDFLQR